MEQGQKGPAADRPEKAPGIRLPGASQHKKERGEARMSVERRPFGVTRDGRQVDKLLLRSGEMEAEVLTYGGRLAALRVPGPAGELVDVVLGCTTVEGYEADAAYLGAIVGRCANRIGNGGFSIDGCRYDLVCNEGSKQLHGGPAGWSFRVFDAVQSGESAVTLTLREEDGANGYPGTMDASVTYTLMPEALEIRYQAVCDRATVCNITNHSYFNLNGGGSVLGHRLWLAAEAYTPVDEDSLPTALSAPVEGTPFDFRQEKPLGRDIGADHPQLCLAGGYDHNFLLRGTGELALAARLTGDRTGIAMETWTTQPGLQLYTANGLCQERDTKSGAPYGPREAVCLETQLPPDSPNHPQWGPVVLRPGQVYRQTTVYRFL